MADHLSDLGSGIELRPATDEDRDLLLYLYGTTRADELSGVAWTEKEKSAFVEMQFSAQDSAYHAACPDGEFLVVVVDGVPSGRLYLGRLERELRLIDIVLSPTVRGRGVGSLVMRWVIERAEQAGMDLTLHVEPWNRARQLYERLGFQMVERRGIYDFMRRPAAGQLKTAS